MTVLEIALCPKYCCIERVSIPLLARCRALRPPWSTFSRTFELVIGPPRSVTRGVRVFASQQKSRTVAALMSFWGSVARGDHDAFHCRPGPHPVQPTVEPKLRRAPQWHRLLFCLHPMKSTGGGRQCDPAVPSTTGGRRRPGPLAQFLYRLGACLPRRYPHPKRCRATGDRSSRSPSRPFP
jgi:hypothetical protein